MKILNTTKNKTIADDAQEPSSLLSKSIGLIGAKKARPLILKTRFGIHTFGVRFPIDVLVLDTDGRVVGTKKNLQPQRIFFWNPKYGTVIELTAETIDRTKTSVGDKLTLDA